MKPYYWFILNKFILEILLSKYFKTKKLITNYMECHLFSLEQNRY